MKKHLFFLSVLTVACLSKATAQQVKFGDNPATIQSGALLELESTDKGLLIPRLTTVQMNGVAVTPQSNGLLIYNTDTGCVFQYTGTEWKSMCSAYTEPWNDKVTQAGATQNTQDIYQMGRTAVGTDYKAGLDSIINAQLTVKGKPNNINSLLVYDTVTSTTGLNAGLISNALILNTGGTDASTSGSAIATQNNLLVGMTPFSTSRDVSVSANSGAFAGLTMSNALGTYATSKNSTIFQNANLKGVKGISNQLYIDQNSTVGDVAAINNDYRVQDGTSTGTINGIFTQSNISNTTAQKYNGTNTTTNFTGATLSSDFNGTLDNITINNASAISGVNTAKRTVFSNANSVNSGSVLGNFMTMNVTGAGTPASFFTRPAIAADYKELNVSNAGGGNVAGDKITVAVSGAGARTSIVGTDNSITYTGTTTLASISGINNSATYNTNASLTPVQAFYDGAYGINSQLNLVSNSNMTGNLNGIRNTINDNRSAGVNTKEIIGIRNNVYLGTNATGQFYSAIGFQSSVGGFQGVTLKYDTVVNYTLGNTVANNMAAGFLIGDIRGTQSAASIGVGADKNVYGFAVSTNSMATSGTGKRYAFFAQGANQLSAFMGNTGIGTTDPQRKLHVVPASASDPTSIRIEGVKEYADNAAAVGAGLQIGDVYRTGDVLKIVH